MSPGVSIIVAVRNGAATLARCLDSIVAQCGVETEVLVKDASSTDGTVELLRSRESELAWFDSSADGGIYDAWNQALPHCRGDLVCFLGADDELAEPTSLARMSASAHGVELVCGLAALHGEHGEFLRVYGRPWVWSQMKRHQLVAHPAMLHRRELFTKYGGFDASYAIAGDYEFLLRVGPQVRTAFVEQIVVRLGGAGVSRKRAGQTRRESWRAQARHPEIGPAAATLNYTVSVASSVARTLLRRP